MSDSLPVGAKEYIEKLASLDSSVHFDFVNWDAVEIEFNSLLRKQVCVVDCKVCEECGAIKANW